MKQNEQWMRGQQLGDGWATDQLYGLGQVTTFLDLMLIAK